ncbi:MAG: isoprenylcysteine carboxylmethyltransferase family protein [Solirubrobacteraceae bacterium]|nr:isoprenylcysteine carboxylmethyltransferase family protein [Solirubrobacteraceae bacterium]
MVAFAVTIVVFLVLAALVLFWARADLRAHGGLTMRSAIASWLLYVLHADSVASAAWGNLVVIDVPAERALVFGATVICVGLALFITASVQLGVRGDFSGMRPRHLVTTGAYRLARHPQNTGWGLLLLGAAIAGRSLVALILVAVFVVFVDRFMRIEDQQLAHDFGETYDAYRATTPAVPLGRRQAAGQPA